MEKLNKIGFYSRYGGKAVGLLIIALIIWGCLPGKKKEVKTPWKYKTNHY